MNDRRWHFNCDTCGAYADGNEEPVEYVAWRHVDELDHRVRMWEHGQRDTATMLTHSQSVDDRAAEDADLRIKTAKEER